MSNITVVEANITVVETKTAYLQRGKSYIRRLDREQVVIYLRYGLINIPITEKSMNIPMESGKHVPYSFGNLECRVNLAPKFQSITLSLNTTVEEYQELIDTSPYSFLYKELLKFINFYQEENGNE